MHDDIEYRVMLARALREAGASFDVIAEVLKARTRIARQRERLQSSPQQIQEIQAARHRQDEAAGVHQGPRHQPLGAIRVFHGHRRSPALKAKREAAVPAWLNGLDMGVAHALLRAGFQNAEEVREAIAKGKVIGRVKARRLSVIEAWLQAAQ